jgi:hypothetical protein
LFSDRPVQNELGCVRIWGRLYLRYPERHLSLPILRRRSISTKKRVSSGRTGNLRNLRNSLIAPNLTARSVNHRRWTRSPPLVQIPA